MPAAVNSSNICPLSVYSKEGEKWSFRGKFFALSRSPRGARGDGRRRRPSVRVRVGPFALPELIWHTAAHASSSPQRRRWGFSPPLPSLPPSLLLRGGAADMHAMLRPRLTKKECRFRLQVFCSCLVHQADEQNCR